MTREITLWGVVLRTAANLFSSRKGDWWHAIRVMIVIAGIGYGGFGLYYGETDRVDLNSDYPRYEQLQIATGMLIRVHTRRTNFLLLEVTGLPKAPVMNNHQIITKNPVIHILSDFTLYNPLERLGWFKNGEFIPHFVTIKYFYLSSGRACVAELVSSGKILINYEQRRIDFDTRHSIQDRLDKECIAAILMGILALTWMFFEAHKQLKREG